MNKYILLLLISISIIAVGCGMTTTGTIPLTDQQLIQAQIAKYSSGYTSGSSTEILSVISSSYKHITAQSVEKDKASVEADVVTRLANYTYTTYEVTNSTFWINDTAAVVTSEALLNYYIANTFETESIPALTTAWKKESGNWLVTDIIKRDVAFFNTKPQLPSTSLFVIAITVDDADVSTIDTQSVTMEGFVDLRVVASSNPNLFLFQIDDSSTNPLKVIEVSPTRTFTFYHKFK